VPYVPGTDLDGLQVTLGSLRFGAVDDTGVAWRLKADDGLQGWDSAEVRAEYTQREADHGAWAAPVYLSERPVTLAGTIEAPDRSALEAAMERLRAAVSLTDTTLTVWESIPKQAAVRRSGKLLLQYLTDRTGGFSALVTAADPRRYAVDTQTGTTMLPSVTGGLAPPMTPPLISTAVTMSGQITATNAGTFESRPVLAITGPVVVPKILAQLPDDTVQVLTYSQTLADGDQLVIDTDAHTVTLNGNVSRRRFLSIPSGWPVVPANATVTFLFTAAVYDPTALLTATWRSAWL